MIIVGEWNNENPAGDTSKKHDVKPPQMLPNSCGTRGSRSHLTTSPSLRSAPGGCSHLFDGLAVKDSRLDKHAAFEAYAAELHEVDSIMDNRARDALQVLRIAQELAKGLILQTDYTVLKLVPPQRRLNL